MAENNSCNINDNKRKALIVINQILQLENLLYNVQAVYDANVMAHSFNAILTVTKDVFSCDSIFANSIKHIRRKKISDHGSPIDNRNEHLVVLGAILVELSMIKGSVTSFMEVHLTGEEKVFLGFNAEEEEEESMEGPMGFSGVSSTEN